MDHIYLNEKALVVELDVAREILYSLGLCARREGDYLLVFNKDIPGSAFFTNENSSESLDSLYINDGELPNCLTNIGVVREFTNPWSETVDYRYLLKIVTKELIPDAFHPTTTIVVVEDAEKDLIKGYHILLDKLDCVVSK